MTGYVKKALSFMISKNANFGSIDLIKSMENVNEVTDE